MKKLILLLTVISFSCKNEILSYPPNNLEVVFHKPGVNYPMRLGCGWPRNFDSLHGGYKYMRIYDKVSVEKFLKLYKEYKIDSTNFGADVRISILVHQGIKTDTLCLGEHFGAIKNGQSMKDSKEILNFVKHKIKYDEY